MHETSKMKSELFPETVAEPTTKLGRFFYSQEIPYGMALVRMVLVIAVMMAMVPRWSRARELYSADGAPAPLALTYGVPGFLPELPGSAVVAMHSVLVFALVTSLIGWRTRLSLWIVTILYTYLNMHDSLSTMTKYSVIATHGLLMLSLSQCGAVWSVDAWLARANRQVLGLPPQILPPAFPSWPRRLTQIFIGVVYFGAALTKIHTPAFFSGEQLQTWMITDYNIPTPLGHYLSQFPSILVIMGYISIVWEMLFLFVSWSGVGRVIMIALGVMFHVMTGFTLGLDVFPVVCISFYFAFLEERDVAQISRAWSSSKLSVIWRGAVSGPVKVFLAGLRAIARVPIPPTAAFAFATALVAAAGVEIEHVMDPYGIRRPEGPYTLKELEPDYVRELLTPTPPIRAKDKFTSLETGTFIAAGHLFDRKSIFKHGETIMIEFGVAPPHEDMWVECCLLDARNRQYNLVGQTVTREMMRGSVYFQLTEVMDPGEYWVAVKCAGKEVMRKPFTLRGGAKSPVAN